MSYSLCLVRCAYVITDVLQLWTEDGVIDGQRHRKHQYKRTWEVLRDEGTHSYKMAHNEKYKVRHRYC
jgi:hypothetical protein